MCNHLTCILSYIAFEDTDPMGFVLSHCVANRNVYCPILQLMVQILWGLW